MSTHSPSLIDAGQGEAILLVHGSLSDHRYWQAQIPALKAHFRVLAPSLGHFWPNTQASTPFSLQQHSRELLQLLDRLSISQAHLLGHSRGAAVALHTALHHGSRVRSLVLTDPVLRQDDDPDLAERNVAAKASGIIQTQSHEAAAAWFLDEVSGPGTWRKLARWFKKMVIDNIETLKLQGTEETMRFNTQQLSGLDERMQVSIIGGELSPLPFRRTSKRLSELWPSARLSWIKNASHGLNLSHPPVFNQLVLRHLQDASR